MITRADIRAREELIDREKRPWRYETGARIPAPPETCGVCDAGWLWQEGPHDEVVVLRCSCW